MIGDTGEREEICEARFFGSGADCTHPAKYLVPYDNSLVCGIHARAFLRCIPLDQFDDGPARAVSPRKDKP